MSRRLPDFDAPPEGQRAYWQERAEREGETYVAKGGREDSFREQLEAIVPYFTFLPGEGRVLDYGCGPGRFRPALEARGLQYHGWDLLPQYRTFEWPPEWGSFDCGTAIFVLQHITHPVAHNLAVRHLHKALRPGGRLLVVDHHFTRGVKWRPHMAPRGPDALKHVGWSGFSRLGEHDGHWIGLFQK